MYIFSETKSFVLHFKNYLILFCLGYLEISFNKELLQSELSLEARCAYRCAYIAFSQRFVQCINKKRYQTIDRDVSISCMPKKNIMLAIIPTIYKTGQTSQESRISTKRHLSACT